MFRGTHRKPSIDIRIYMPMIPSSSSCFYAYNIIYVVMNILCVCVCVCECVCVCVSVCVCVCGWEGGGRKTFQDCGRLVSTASLVNVQALSSS